MSVFTKIINGEIPCYKVAEDDEFIAFFDINPNKALEKVVPCERIGVAVVGLEVPHVHVHLIPISEMKEMTFQHKVKLTDEEFKELSEKVRKAL